MATFNIFRNVNNQGLTGNPSAVEIDYSSVGGIAEERKDENQGTEDKHCCC